MQRSPLPPKKGKRGDRHWNRVRTPAVVMTLLAALLAGCGSSSEALDMDSDGLSDGEEFNGWIITIDLVGQRISRHVTSDPAVPDTDGDGVTDAFELGLGLDPRSKDTDEDGLTDCQEARHSVIADCENPDWAGLPDGGTGTIANNADSDPGYGRYINNVLGYDDGTGTITGDQIGWGDGISDGVELSGYTVELPNNVTVTVKTDPMRKDTDADFLEDGEEALVYGTHPQVPDTDKDGCVDGLDLFPRFEERFDVGLQSIKLNAGGQIRFLLRVVDALQDPPGGQNGIRASAGVEIDLSAQPTEPVRPPQCSFAPHQPWIPVEVLVQRIDGDRARTLDLWSNDDADANFRVWWNVRTDVVALAEGAEGTAGGITRTGPDGTLTFAPRVVPPGGQTT